MAPIDLTKPDRPLEIGVVLLSGTTELLDVAPVDFFNLMNPDIIKLLPEGSYKAEHTAQAFRSNFHWVTETGEAAKLSCGLSVQATDSFASCPALDIVLMGANEMKEPTEAEMAFLRGAYAGCAAFITICAGVHAPLRAGLLRGKTATAPSLLLPLYRAQAPDVHWVDRRCQRDGKLWTSNTLLNGADAVRDFALHTWGPDSLASFSLDFGGFPNRDPDF